ncbi:MAG: dienelactone hydrolase family protein [Chromatiaceae bacterium]|nr:dienelactone hydrolase family protein [Chromatiaceae bacterium]
MAVLLAGCAKTVHRESAHLAWEHMMYILPANATKSGVAEKVRYNNEKLASGWSEQVQNENLKPDVKLPAVLYMHGCTGISSGYAWGNELASMGLAVFLPDSYARPNRDPWCSLKRGSLAPFEWRIQQRIHELEYALSQIRNLPWVDQDRVVLMGFSEGGATVAYYPRKDFVAHIVIGQDCPIGFSRGGPNGIPVLNIVGSEDEWGKGLCNIAPDAQGSRSVLIKGAYHDVSQEPEAHAALAEFLAKCCGINPTKGR